MALYCISYKYYLVIYIIYLTVSEVSFQSVLKYLLNLETSL